MGSHKMKNKFIPALLAVALLSLSSAAYANEVEQIRGAQLMTPAEAQQHKEAMRNAKTAEEREMIRQKHHEKMRLRAKEKGVPFSDKAPAERGHVNQQNAPGMGQGRVFHN